MARLFYIKKWTKHYYTQYTFYFKFCLFFCIIPSIKLKIGQLWNSYHLEILLLQNISFTWKLFSVHIIFHSYHCIFNLLLKNISYLRLRVSDRVFSHQATKIGKAVNALRGHRSNQISQFAQTLIEYESVASSYFCLHWWLSLNGWTGNRYDLMLLYYFSLSQYIDNEDPVSILLNLIVVSFVLFVDSGY